MRTYITLDGGTTNTRLSLVSDGIILQTVKISMGARTCIDDAPALRGESRDTIRTLLSAYGLHECNVERVLVSGMITCELGLCHLPHVTSPAELSELHDSMHEVVLSDISPIPFVFIRGVKSFGKDLCDTDMMRGEEAELMGILRDMGEKNALRPAGIPLQADRDRRRRGCFECTRRDTDLRVRKTKKRSFRTSFFIFRG